MTKATNDQGDGARRATIDEVHDVGVVGALRARRVLATTGLRDELPDILEQIAGERSGNLDVVKVGLERKLADYVGCRNMPSAGDGL